MGDVLEKLKHSKRIKDKKKEVAKRQETQRVGRVRSVIAKELLTSGKYKQRVIRDKRGKFIDAETYTYADLVRDIQEE